MSSPTQYTRASYSRARQKARAAMQSSLAELSGVFSSPEVEIQRRQQPSVPFLRSLVSSAGGLQPAASERCWASGPGCQLLHGWAALGASVSIFGAWVLIFTLCGSEDRVPSEKRVPRGGERCSPSHTERQQVRLPPESRGRPWSSE